MQVLYWMANVGFRRIMSVYITSIRRRNSKLDTSLNFYFLRPVSFAKIGTYFGEKKNTAIYDDKKLLGAPKTIGGAVLFYLIFAI